MRKLLLLCLTGIPIALSAKFKFDLNFKQAYTHLFNLRINDAKKIIESEKKANPENSMLLFLENQIDFITLFTNENPAEFNRLKSEKLKRINRIKKDTTNTPWKDYCIAEIMLHWSFLEFKFNDPLQGFLDAKKARELLLINKQKFPLFEPNDKCLALINCLAGNIPDEYSIVTNLTNMKGSVNEGLRELHRFFKLNSETALLFKNETALYITFLSLNLHNNPELFKDVYEYVKNNSGKSPLLLYASTKIIIHLEKNSSVLQLIDSVSFSDNTLPLNYIDYIKGQAYLNDLNYALAQKCFMQYVSKHTGHTYKAAAYQKIAWCGLLQGNDQQYLQYIQLCNKSTFMNSDEDMQAVKEFNSQYIPNTTLLKARLLFDGGHYNAALDVLLKQLPSAFITRHQDIIEFEYRIARVNQGLGEYDKALRYYDLVIAHAKTFPYYYAANAALNAGLLCEKHNNAEKAIEYYKACLLMQPGEYKKSMHLKAKAGINRLSLKD